jgi:hypothetical protein
VGLVGAPEAFLQLLEKGFFLVGSRHFFCRHEGSPFQD